VGGQEGQRKRHKMSKDDTQMNTADVDALKAGSERVVLRDGISGNWGRSRGLGGKSNTFGCGCRRKKEIEKSNKKYDP